MKSLWKRTSSPRLIQNPHRSQRTRYWALKDAVRAGDDLPAVVCLGVPRIPSRRQPEDPCHRGCVGASSLPTLRHLGQLDRGVVPEFGGGPSEPEVVNGQLRCIRRGLFAGTLRFVPQSAVSPQQSLPQLSATNRANRLTCAFMVQPTQLYRANAHEVSFGTKRSWVRIPPPRLASS